MSKRLILCAALAAAGCADEKEPEVGSAASAVAVTWTSLVGVGAAGNDLSKTGAAMAFDAGAVSIETIAGDGYVELTTAEANTAKQVGLSNGNAGVGQADIDFAIRLKANGGVSVYEAGVLRGNFGSYAPGDLLRVEVDGGVVRYRRNGAVLYTSLVAPTFPLLVDTSLLTPGATINDVELASTSLNWQNVVGVAVSGNDLTKTAGTSTWSAGASSVEPLSGDGFVEFVAGENNTAKAAGLSSGDSSQHYTDIDFAIRLNANGVVYIYEAGVLRGNFGSYLAGDRFRVEVAGGVVRYSMNGGVPLFTSAIAPTFPLLVDTAFLTSNGTINDVTLTEAANACPAYDGGGMVCDGSFVVNNSFDLAEIAGCANISGNLTIDAPGMTVIALPALERVGGDLRITGNNTLTRLRLPELKQIGGTTLVWVYDMTDGFDLSRLRSSGRLETIHFDDDYHIAYPCLDTSGTLYAREWNGSDEVTAPLHVPRLRQIINGFISAHIDVPLLETVAGSIIDGTIDAPILTSVTGNVGAIGLMPSLDAPSLTDIGGTLDYWAVTNVPALERAGSLVIRDRSSFDLPNLVEVTGMVSSASSPCGAPITAQILDLPALELAGGIYLCWPALQEVSLPQLRRITGGLGAGGIYIRPNSTAIAIDFPELERVRGTVDVYAGTSFPALTFVRGGLRVRYPMIAPALTEVDGRLTLYANLSADLLATVTNLVEVFGGVTALSLPSLASVDGFVATNSTLEVLELPSLTTIVGAGQARDAGDFRLEESEVIELDLASLESVQDEFEVFGNASMTVLAAPALTALGPLLRISVNADLPSCYAMDIRDLLLASGWAGTAIINGNNGTGTCP